MKRTLLLAIVVSGCSGGGKDDGPCAYEHRGAGATAQYHADVTCATNPFPSDVLRSGTTVTLPAERFTWRLPRTEDYDVAREYVTTVASSYDADGFSPIAPILISVDDRVDPGTAAQGVSLWRFTTGVPAADSTALVATYDSNLSSLVLQPQMPLAPSTTYGVVVDADLLDMQGRPTTRSTEFDAALEAPGADLASLLGAAGESDRIALAFTFTTQTIHPPLYAVRDRIFGVLGSALMPAFTDEFTALEEGRFANGSTQFTDTMVEIGISASATSNIGFIVNGSFDSFDFRGPDGRAWDAALVTGPAAPPTAKLVFRIGLPFGTPPDPAGWPLVIFGHGLSGYEADVYEQCQRLCPYGFAVASIPAVQHGRRGDVISFFDWESIPGTRESFRQTTADQLQLLRMLRNGAGMPELANIDTDDVTYYGISLGGILGTPFVASAPGLDRALLVVPGGHLSTLLYAPSVAANYLWPFISNFNEIDPVLQPVEWQDFLRGFRSLVQIGLDPGDPVNWGTQVNLASTPILMIENVGDTYVTNDSNEALRRALGLPILTSAATSASPISGAWIYRSSDFPSDPILGTSEPHGWFSRDDFCRGRAQAFHWLQTGGLEVLDPTALTCP